MSEMCKQSQMFGQTCASKHLPAYKAGTKTTQTSVEGGIRIFGFGGHCGLQIFCFSGIWFSVFVKKY